jgi:hypothetical protein
LPLKWNDSSAVFTRIEKGFLERRKQQEGCHKIRFCDVDHGYERGGDRLEDVGGMLADGYQASHPLAVTLAKTVDSVDDGHGAG